MAVLAGDFEPGSVIIQGPKGTSAAIAKGDLVMLDSANHVWITTPATTEQIGPFGVCAAAALTADTSVSVIIDGRCYVTVDATLVHPVHYVQNSATVAGRIMEFVSDAATAATAAVNAIRIVGQYEGHENEGTINALPSNTASGDIVRVTLGTSG